MAIFKPLAPWIWRQSKDKLFEIPFGGIQKYFIEQVFHRFKDRGRNKKASFWGSLVSYTANKPRVTRLSLALFLYAMKNIIIVQPFFTFLFPNQKSGVTGQAVFKAEGQGCYLSPGSVQHYL